MFNNPIIYKFLKDFVDLRKKTNKTVIFNFFPNILKYTPTSQTFQQSGKQDSFKTLLEEFSWYVRKLGSHISLEPPLEYSQDQTDAFDESKFIMTFLTILGVTQRLCSLD